MAQLGDTIIKGDLEVLGDCNIQGTLMLQGLLNLFYPVGSYYETSDVNFDPNVSWGGTWVQDTVGRCTVGANTNEDPGVTKNGLVNLSVNELVGSASTTVNFNHTHAQTHVFTSQYGTDNGLKYMQGESAVYDTVATQPSDWSTMIGTSDPIVSSKITLGDKTWSNVQPSVDVVRWHRTA